MNGINVIGYFHSSVGLGFTARSFRDVLRSIDIPVCSISIRREMICDLADDAEDLRKANPEHDTNLIIVSPASLKRLIRTDAPEILKNRRNIFLHFWETNELPAEFVPALSAMDDIWTCTGFVAETVRKHIGIPVSSIPHLIHTPPPPKPEDLEPFRFNDRFAFLFVFDFLSGIQRKNPLAAVEAFKLAFPTPSTNGPILVLKSAHGEKLVTDLTLLDLAIEGRPDIIHLKKVLPYPEKCALMARADTYVSLHRAEGLGLTILEAMSIGKPCIVTNYSGSTDFATPDNAYLCPYEMVKVGHRSVHYDARAVWAEPDVREAARLMQHVFYSQEEAIEKGRLAKQKVTEGYSAEAAGRAIQRFFEESPRRDNPGCELIAPRTDANQQLKEAAKLERKADKAFRRFFRRAHERINLQFRRHRRAISSALKIQKENKLEIQTQIRELRAIVYRLQTINELLLAERDQTREPPPESGDSNLEALEALQSLVREIAKLDPIFSVTTITKSQGDLRGFPRAYISCTIDLLRLLGGSTVVEIGCMRRPIDHPVDELDRACCLDGHSTFFWARSGLNVHSVDIDEDAVKVATDATKDFPNAVVSCGDGIEFIRQFEGTIDLLFLDAWDVYPDIPFAEKHLEAWQLAKEKLTPSHIIQIDDTDIANGGKGALLIPELVKNGYEILAQGRQTVAVKLSS
ncbi:MAG: glycosyltransferase [Verrucomicrobiota bacterium]